MFVVCEEWEETRTDCYTDPSSSFRPYQHFFLILARVAQPWVTVDPKPYVWSWFSLRHLISNWLEPPSTWLYYFLTSICFRCSSTYLHRCISWLTAWSRVNITNTGHSLLSEFQMILIFFFATQGQKLCNSLVTSNTLRQLLSLLPLLWKCPTTLNCCFLCFGCMAYQPVKVI